MDNQQPTNTPPTPQPSQPTQSAQPPELIPTQQKPTPPTPPLVNSLFDWKLIAAGVVIIVALVIGALYFREKGYQNNNHVVNPTNTPTQTQVVSQLPTQTLMEETKQCKTNEDCDGFGHICKDDGMCGVLDENMVPLITNQAY